MRSVVVFGPNLSAADQRKGDFHVHAEGCAHGKKLARYDSFTMEASCREDVVRDIYAEHMDEVDTDDWRRFDDLYVAPCLRGKEWK